jgi:hypothetical protein
MGPGGGGYVVGMGQRIDAYRALVWEIEEKRPL